MLSERRNTAAARRFFKHAIASNGQPDLVDIDKSGAKFAGLQAVNKILKFKGNGQLIAIRQKKYLNNIPEQDHRFRDYHATSVANFCTAVLSRAGPELLRARMLPLRHTG